MFVHTTVEAAQWQTAEELQSRISMWLPRGYDFDIQEDTSLIRGVAVFEKDTNREGYRFIDKDLLELDPGKRLLQLFEIESEWVQEDLVPFIKWACCWSLMLRDLTDFGFGLPGDLLLKYCREVSNDPNGEKKKYYVLRH